MPIAANSNPGMKCERVRSISDKHRSYGAYLLAFVLVLAATVVCCAVPAQAIEPSNDVWWRVNGTTLELRGTSAADYEKWDANPEEYSGVPWIDQASSITTVAVTDALRPFSINSWFAGMGSLITLNLKALDLSSCVDMQYVFARCSNLTSVDLSGMNTSQVENMYCLFWDCPSLKTVNMRGCKAPKLENCGEMFEGCTSLERIDLSTLGASSVAHAFDMFSGCSSLLTADVSGLGGEADACFMFVGCDKLVGFTFGSKFAFDPVLLGLRDGVSWTSSANGKTYASNAIPSLVAATYYIPGTEGEPKSKGSGTQDGRRVLMRLYNPNSGEHFYTSDQAEHDHLVELGWSSEGVGWNAPVTSGTPVYRLYNGNAGEHHYTASSDERDALVGLGWSSEGIGWYSDDAHHVPLYRLYNPNELANNHHYTTNQEERDSLVTLGWQFEGLAWYGVA